MPKLYKDLPLREVKELLKKMPPNVKIRVYYEGMKNKYTLDQIGDALFEFIKVTNERLNRIEARLDLIEKRLDYNGLKKLPNNQ